jgi:hypothetical protein
MTTRAKHLLWCKTRALAYLEQDDTTNAYASMTSDLRKHPETEHHPAIMLGMMLMMSGGLSTTNEMREFIEGFN